ncbi:UNVERIFIED_CONTAM: hypothetical protein Slati_4244800 [Sesamum latifolium]|uniref:Reverse transcriptase domain-containing protein n=1 Tax=Sesamum latifolium TaxID=2727402 RepID=A0AAW2TBJ3_9LAMI
MSSLLFNRPNKKRPTRKKSLIGTLQRQTNNAVMVHALTLEAEYWKQKSNCKWLEAGERNKTFILSPRYQRRNNNLCLIPTEEDIKETVFSIDKESVAGPDGFSSAFYQACWEFIARDIYDAVRDFFSGTPMPRSFTATTIVLIPKVDSPQTWNDFRPISLCNVTNKILSKLLYRRISQALPELISPSQSGFVPAEALSKGLDFLFSTHPDMYYQTQCAIKPSHLSYADDVIIFTNCKEAGLARLIQFLRGYENMSGQKINYAKSAFIPGRKASLIAQRIKAITGFTMKALPITYLGAPLYKEQRKIHWTKWYNVCFPIEEGGLGIRNLRDMVTAFSYKLWWRVRLNNSLWSRFTISKYCQDTLRRSPNSSLLMIRASGKECAAFGRTRNLTFFGAWVMVLFLSGMIGGSRKAFWRTWLVLNAVSTSRSTGFWLEHEWDIHKLQQAVPQHIIEKIMDVPINTYHSDFIGKIQARCIHYKICLG